MTVNTLTLPPPVREWFTTAILSTPQPRLIHTPLARKYTVPERSGDIIRMRRYNRLATAPVPLGVNMNNPPSQLQTVVDLDARLDWYATFIITTRQVTLINQDPVLNEMAARLGQSMRETEDELVRAALEATASVVNCTNGVNGDNPTELTAADLADVVQQLQTNDGDFITNMIDGEDKFGTGPISDAYMAMAHTSLIGQLANVAGFIRKAQYPNQVGVLSTEWGSAENVRFLLSSRGSITTNASMLGADILNIFITAQESYAMVELTGANADYIYHGPGWGDDPVELRQTVGWRMTQVSRVTQNLWLFNLRTTLA